MTVDPEAEDLQLPQRFPGIYSAGAYAPILVETRRRLRSLPVPPHVFPQYSYGVLEHAQPTYMLLPVMFLFVCDHLGGVTERDRNYFTWHILSMELAAILDDTVDRNPLRSGRPTYSERYGEASATAFCAYLESIMAMHLFEEAAPALPIMLEFFAKLSSLEVWEHHSRYPRVDLGVGEEWHRRRYEANAPAIATAVDSALVLHGHPRLPAGTIAPFSELMQDVDDLVNIVEDREVDGEHSDLRSGIVTAPLLAAMDADQSVVALVEEFWAPYREIPTQSRDAYRSGMEAQARRDRKLYELLCSKLKSLGVAATVERIQRNAASFTDRCPENLRSCLEAAVTPWVDRVRPMLERHASEVVALTLPPAEALRTGTHS